METEDWNSKIEDVVQSIGEVSKQYKLKHIQQAKLYSFKHKKLMTVGIVSGPLAGLCSGIQLVYNYSYLSVLSTIISCLSGIILSIVKFAKYDHLSLSHKTAAARYTSLESNIRQQLALYRKDRIPSSIYLKWVSESFDSLFSSSPIVTIKNSVILTSSKENPEYENNKINELKDDTVIYVEKEIPKKRLKTFSQNQDLNKYNEDSMNYELKRLFGFSP
jgi:hypothetical protein